MEKEKLTVIVEKTNTGYSAYVPEIPGIVTAADNFDELRDHIRELLEMFIETSRTWGDPVPAILEGEYTVEYKFDIRAFMQWMTRVMSQRGLSEIAEINETLISQYANGVKKPGPKQLKKIQKSIHRFADDLHSISF